MVGDEVIVQLSAGVWRARTVRAVDVNPVRVWLFGLEYPTEHGDHVGGWLSYDEAAQRVRSTTPADALRSPETRLTAAGYRAGYLDAVIEMEALVVRAEMMAEHERAAAGVCASVLRHLRLAARHLRAMAPPS